MYTCIYIYMYHTRTHHCSPSGSRAMDSLHVRAGSTGFVMAIPASGLSGAYLGHILGGCCMRGVGAYCILSWHSNQQRPTAAGPRVQLGLAVCSKYGALEFCRGSNLQSNHTYSRSGFYVSPQALVLHTSRHWASGLDPSGSAGFGIWILPVTTITAAGTFADFLSFWPFSRHARQPLQRHNRRGPHAP